MFSRVAITFDIIKSSRPGFESSAVASARDFYLLLHSSSMCGIRTIRERSWDGGRSAPRTWYGGRIRSVSRCAPLPPPVVVILNRFVYPTRVDGGGEHGGDGNQNRVQPSARSGFNPTDWFPHFRNWTDRKRPLCFGHWSVKAAVVWEEPVCRQRTVGRGSVAKLARRVFRYNNHRSGHTRVCRPPGQTSHAQRSIPVGDKRFQRIRNGPDERQKEKLP